MRSLTISEIILDKSYLDGAPTASVQWLCEHFRVLMSEDLFFELITTEAWSQKRCFSKLPDQETPVTLLPNVGSLLRFEQKHQHQCNPLTQHSFPDRYVFNKKLREGILVCDGEALENLNAWRAQVEADTKDFVQRCKVVHQFFPELSGIEWKNFPSAMAEARRKISSNQDFVREIYASFLDEDAPSEALWPDLLTPDWAWFRWVQCQILAALRIFERHQGRFPENTGADFWRKAEHSMLDVHYVILGSLAGALATLDTEIRDDFLTVRPDAVMLSPGVLGGAGANPPLNTDARQR